MLFVVGTEVIFVFWEPSLGNYNNCTLSPHRTRLWRRQRKIPSIIPSLPHLFVFHLHFFHQRILNFLGMFKAACSYHYISRLGFWFCLSLSNDERISSRVAGSMEWYGQVPRIVPRIVGTPSLLELQP